MSEQTARPECPSGLVPDIVLVERELIPGEQSAELRLEALRAVMLLLARNVSAHRRDLRRRYGERTVSCLPPEIRWPLPLHPSTSQIRRAAVSVPANIAEGAARAGTGEFLQFLSVASGSLAEVEMLLILAARLQFLKEPQLEELQEPTSEIGRMLAGLKRSLQSRRSSPPTSPSR